MNDDTAGMMEARSADGETTSSMTAKVPTSRDRWKRDGDLLRRIRPDGGIAAVFNMSLLPFAATDYLSQMGLVAVLSRSETPNETFKGLCDGSFPRNRGAVEKKTKVSDWRLAIASALVEATKKLPEPLSLEQATAKALALPRGKLADAKKDQLVLKHYNKLHPEDNVGDLLALVD